jgi:EmrB/QacA subfamily drug resistance transporter
MEATAAIRSGGRRKWFVLLALTPGVFLALADATVMTIALPSMIQTMSSSVTMVSWVLNGYNLVLTTLFLTMGRLGDRSGRKLVFMSGLALFVAASVGCALSPTVPWVIFFRVFQATGAAAMIPMALTILLAAFPRTQQGLAAGLFGGLSVLAASLGPVLGGLLITYGSWHWIFWFNVPVGILGFALTAALVRRDDRGRRRERMDLPGVALVTSGLFCLTLGLIQANTWGWLSAPIVALFIAAAGLLLAWVFWELRTPQPLFDLRLFRSRSFAAANSAMTMVDVAMMGTAFMLVIYLVALMDYSELKAAAAVTFVPAAGLVLAPFAGYLIDRIGPRWLAFGGSLLTAVGLVFLARLSRSDGFTDVIWRTLLVGAGPGITLPSLTAAGMTSLPAAVRGVGSGMLNTARQLGFLLGVAILVAVFAHTMHTSVVRAADQAKAIIDGQQQISQPLKDYLDTAIEQAKTINATASFADVRKLIHRISGVALPPISAKEALVLLSLRTSLEQLFTDEVAAGFYWPFMTAAIAALFSALSALFLQRRLDVHGPPAEAAVS